MADNFPTQPGQIDYLNQSPDLLNSKPQQTQAPMDPGASFSNFMKQSADVAANDVFNGNTTAGVKGMFAEMNKPVGPQSVGYASPDVDQYRFQEDFESRGFNPEDPKNMDRWTAAETWGSALSKGFDSFGTRFGNTFVDYWKDYGRMGSALVNWDLSKLQPSESEMLTQYYRDQKESMKNFVFVPPDQENDIFSKKTMSDMIANAGFALGTVAGFSLELAADIGITWATGGAGAEVFGGLAFKSGQLGAKMFGKRIVKEAAKEGAEALGKTVAKEAGKEAVEAAAETAAKQATASGGKGFSNFFSDLSKGWSKIGDQTAEQIVAENRVLNGIQDAEKLKKLGTETDGALRGAFKDLYRMHSYNIGSILKSKSFEEFALNVGKGVPLLGTAVSYGEKIAKGAEVGLSAGKLTGIGLRGLHRMAQEYNMAATEASMEGITTYGDTLDQMVKGYKDTHDGENPDGLEFNKMKEYATQASFTNYGTNMAILLASNQIQFGGLFNKFMPNQKWARDFLTEESGKILGVNRLFKSSPLLAQEYEKGFLGTYGLLGKIGKDFGKKQALYELGNALRKDIFKFEVTEGLQENLQEITATGWKEYYANKYKGMDGNLSAAFGKGVDAQITKQGFNTFLQGALTGSVLRLPTYLTTKATQGLANRAQASEYKDQNDNPLVKMQKRMKEDMNLRNDMYRKMSESKVDGKVFNFNVQVESALHQQEAALKGSEYEWHNARDNSLLHGIINANQSGMGDTYVQAVRDMGETMTDEQFESAFGVKLSDTKYKTAKDFTNSVANDLENYSKAVDDIRNNVKNMMDPFMFKAGSKEQYLASVLRNKQEDYIRIIALNKLKGVRASERAQKIASELNSIEELSASSNYALRTLTDSRNLIREMGNIRSELRILEESLKAEGLSADVKSNIEEQVKDKKQELALFEKWQGYWKSRADVVTVKNEKGEDVQKVQLGDIVFVGKKLKDKKKNVDETGKVISEEDAYNETDEEVLDTFRRLMNVKNKQSGINANISEKTARESFGKIVDFIRLDTDAKDYMEAYDGLYNPEAARQMLGRMIDGDFKNLLLDFVDGLSLRMWKNAAEYVGAITTIKKADDKGEMKDIPIGSTAVLQITQKFFNGEALTANERVIFFQTYEYVDKINTAIKSSDAYKNLIIISVNDDLGIAERNLAIKQMDEIQTIIQDQFTQIAGLKTEKEKIADETKEQKESDVISDIEYQDFVNDKVVTESRIRAIAEKLKKKEKLSEREKAMYDANSSVIDSLIKETPNPETPEQKEAPDEATAKRIAEIEARLVEIINEQMKTGALEGTPESEALEKELDELRKGKAGEVKGEETAVETLTPGEQKNESKEDFFVSVAEDGTINVVSKDGTIINGTPIESVDKANELVKSLLTDKINTEFAMEFFKDVPVNSEGFSVKLSSFITRGKRSLVMYNKSSEKPIENLQDYHDTIKGRKALDLIKQSVLTGKSLDELKKEERKKEKAAAEGTQTDLFDTTEQQTQSPVSIEDIDDILNDVADILEPTPISTVDIENFKIKITSFPNKSSSFLKGTFDTPDGKGFFTVKVLSDGTAYIYDIQLGDFQKTDTSRGKGYGLIAYVQIGKQLKNLGYTLESTQWSKHISGISPQALRVWEKLVKQGYAKVVGQTENKVYNRETGEEQVKITNIYQFTETKNDIEDRIKDYEERIQTTNRFMGDTDSNAAIAQAEKDVARYEEEIKKLKKELADLQKQSVSDTMTKNGSLVKDAMFSVPVLLTSAQKADNVQQTYIPREVIEKAYEQYTKEGSTQTLESVISRGGFAVSELDNLLPNWRELMTKVTEKISTFEEGKEMTKDQLYDQLKKVMSCKKG